jgi:lipopolysaccharide transport protein LptA
MPKKKFWRALACLGVVLSVFPASLSAQQPSGTVTAFRIVESYDPPDQNSKRSMTVGEKADQLDRNRYRIKGARFETYRKNGETNQIARAPECFFDKANQIVYSAGPLQAQTGDGSLFIEGEGFLMLQTNSSLIISNHVRSAIQRGLLTTQTGSNGPAKAASPPLAVPGAARAGTNAVPATNQFVNILSDHFWYDGQSNLIVYTGNVRVDDPEMDLACETLAIQRATNGAIESIVASRNVTMVNKATGSRVTGDQAVYSLDQGQQLVTITGHPRWQDGSQEGTADVFIFNRTKNNLRANGQAYLKIPRGSVGRFGLLPSATNAPVATNKFVEAFADHFIFQLPPTNGPVQSVLGEKDVVLLDPENQGRATGGRMTYTEAGGTMELTDNPVWRSGGRVVMGDVLSLDRTNAIFSSRGNAYVKFPVSALAGPPAPDSGKTNNAGANTNRFVEVLSDEAVYEKSWLKFHDHVRANLLEKDVVLGRLNSDRLQVDYTSNQVHGLVAEGHVIARQLPVPNSRGDTRERELRCETLTVTMRTNGLVENIVAEQNVAGEQVQIRKDKPKPVRSTLVSEVMTADFFARSNEVERVVAERNVAITRDETFASGSKAVYTATNAWLQLTGRPMAVLTNATAIGDVITMDQRGNRLWIQKYDIAVEPANQRTNKTSAAKKTAP